MRNLLERQPDVTYLAMVLRMLFRGEDPAGDRSRVHQGLYLPVVHLALHPKRNKVVLFAGEDQNILLNSFS